MHTETKIPKSRLDLINNEGKAIEEAVAWHTVSLIADKSKSVATGSAILWGERPLILTANHVVKDSPDDDIWFHFRPEGTMKRAPINKLHSHPEMQYTHKVKIHIGRRYTSEDLDLVALEVERSIETEHRLRFFALAKESFTPPAETIVVMIGHPFDLAKRVAPGTAASFSMIQWSRIKENPKSHLKDFNPANEFVTDFKAVHQVKHAGGFSGAGVWFDRPTDGVWHPNLGLAGVCTHYYHRPKLLLVVRIEHVLRFLDAAFSV
jgi:hypothetical protein